MPSRWEEAWKEAAARNVAELEAAGVRVSEAEYARLDAGGGLSREETFLDASCELLLLLRARFLGIASKSAARGFVENLEECLALFADHGNSEKALQTLLELQRAIEGSEDLPSKRKRTLRAVARKAFFATARAVDSKGDGPAAGAALPFLPPTVLSHAFRHLSPLDLARCACVSREWRGVVAVGEPRFFRELHRKVCPLVDNGADDRWKKTYLEKATAHGLVFHRDFSLRRGCMKCFYLEWWVHPSRPPQREGCLCGMHGVPFTSAMAVAVFLAEILERALPGRAGKTYFTYWSKAIQPLLLSNDDDDYDSDDDDSDS